jgi:hypothetical protein
MNPERTTWEEPAQGITSITLEHATHIYIPGTGDQITIVLPTANPVASNWSRRRVGNVLTISGPGRRVGSDDPVPTVEITAPPGISFSSNP